MCPAGSDPRDQNSVPVAVAGSVAQDWEARRGVGSVPDVDTVTGSVREADTVTGSEHDIMT